MTLTDLSIAITRWSHNNFPMNSNRDPLLGVVEEFTLEYYNAYLVGGHDEIKDAITDTMIYLLNYCGLNGLDPMECISLGTTPQEHFGDTRLLLDGITLGRLCQVALKRHQGIKLEDNSIEDLKKAVGDMFVVLLRCGKHHNFDTLIETHSTWKSIVSKRDWNAHREGGDIGG